MQSVLWQFRPVMTGWQLSVMLRRQLTERILCMPIVFLRPIVILRMRELSIFLLRFSTQSLIWLVCCRIVRHCTILFLQAPEYEPPSQTPKSNYSYYTNDYTSNCAATNT